MTKAPPRARPTRGKKAVTRGWSLLAIVAFLALALLPATGVRAAPGDITTVAGNGTQGFSGDGGPASSAQLYGPAGVAVDSAGNLYIADWGNHRVRKVAAATGVITTVAGSGPAGVGSGGFSGDGGPATSARLHNPAGVAVDAAGNLFIADQGNIRVRKVAAATGIISTVAGKGTESFSGDGGAGTSAGVAPADVAVDAAGNVFIADESNNRIRKVDAATGIISTVAGNGTRGFSGDGVPATSAMLNGPPGVELDAAGNLFIADRFNNRIRRVDFATGIITTVAGNGTDGFSGDGGPATNAALSRPINVLVDGAGNLFIADHNNNQVRWVDTATGIIKTVPLGLSNPFGVVVATTGDLAGC